MYRMVEVALSLAIGEPSQCRAGFINPGQLVITHTDGLINLLVAILGHDRVKSLKPVVCLKYDIYYLWGVRE